MPLIFYTFHRRRYEVLIDFSLLAIGCWQSVHKFIMTMPIKAKDRCKRRYIGVFSLSMGRELSRNFIPYLRIFRLPTKFPEEEGIRILKLISQ